MALNQIVFSIENAQSQPFTGTSNYVVLTPIFNVLDGTVIVDDDSQVMTASNPGAVTFNNVPANFYSASIRTPYSEADYVILVPSGLNGTASATTLLYSASLAFPPTYSVYNSVTASYALTASCVGPSAAVAWNNFSVIGQTITNNQVFNSYVGRAGVGIYTCSFAGHPATRIPYCVSITAGTGSTNAAYILAPTASFGTPYGLTLNGFTMSIVSSTAPTTSADPISASLVVFSY